jgi:hypothetical protein
LINRKGGGEGGCCGGGGGGGGGGVLSLSLRMCVHNIVFLNKLLYILSKFCLKKNMRDAWALLLLTEHSEIAVM